MNKPKVILLIGHPLVGKSTWVRNNYPNAKVISRDDIVLEVYGSDDFNMAFDYVDQKEVDKILTQRLIEAGLQSDDIIIDMTHMTRKRRMKNLMKFPNHTKVGIVFPHLTDDDEIIRRNQIRLYTEKKSIPISVIKDMIKNYQEPTKDEGFDEIIILK
jgi:predicted kinase